MERLQIEALRKRGSSWRFAWTRSLTRTVVQLARRALRRARPGMGELEMHEAFLKMHYGSVLEPILSDTRLGEPMLAPDIAAAVSPLIDALESLGVRYSIGGSVASSVHGIPRSTLDVDLVADLRQEHVGLLVERLEDTYHVSEPMIREAIVRRSSFNLLHLATFLKVDVFVLGNRPYDREALSRAVRDTLTEDEPDRTIVLFTPEDVLLSKLEWYRLGGEVSDRQWNDVLGILKVQDEVLDRSYLERWAGELRVADLLARALEDAGR